MIFKGSKAPNGVECAPYLPTIPPFRMFYLGRRKHFSAAGLLAANPRRVPHACPAPTCTWGQARSTPDARKKNITGANATALPRAFIEKARSQWGGKGNGGLRVHRLEAYFRCAVSRRPVVSKEFLLKLRELVLRRVTSILNRDGVRRVSQVRRGNKERDIGCSRNSTFCSPVQSPDSSPALGSSLHPMPTSCCRFLLPSCYAYPQVLGACSGFHGAASSSIRRGWCDPSTAQKGRSSKAAVVSWLCRPRVCLRCLRLPTRIVQHSGHRAGIVNRGSESVSGVVGMAKKARPATSHPARRSRRVLHTTVVILAAVAVRKGLMRAPPNGRPTFVRSGCCYCRHRWYSGNQPLRGTGRPHGGATSGS